jgi:hypothetical protein
MDRNQNQIHHFAFIDSFSNPRLKHTNPFLILAGFNDGIVLKGILEETRVARIGPETKNWKGGKKHSSESRKQIPL